MTAPERLPYKEPADPDDIHTALAETVSTRQAETVQFELAERTGAAEAAVALAVAQTREALRAYAGVQSSLIERARVAALAAEHLHDERDRYLHDCLEAGFLAPEIARATSVRPAEVVMAAMHK